MFKTKTKVSVVQHLGLKNNIHVYLFIVIERIKNLYLIYIKLFIFDMIYIKLFSIKYIYIYQVILENYKVIYKIIIYMHMFCVYVYLPRDKISILDILETFCNYCNGKTVAETIERVNL